MLHLKIFLTAILVFLITDMIWLGFIAKNAYFSEYGAWLRLLDGKLQPIWWAALAVYIMFGISLVVFIAPLAQENLLHAATYGAVLGLIIYGVYDFTCLAIFKDWPVKMAFVDVAWGTFLYAFGSATTLFIVYRFLK